MSGVYADVMKAVGAGARIFEVTDRVPEMPVSGGLVPETCEVKRHICPPIFYQSLPVCCVLISFNRSNQIMIYIFAFVLSQRLGTLFGGGVQVACASSF